MPNGNVLALLLLAALVAGVAHAAYGMTGLAWALAVISFGALALALWTMLDGG